MSFAKHFPFARLRVRISLFQLACCIIVRATCEATTYIRMYSYMYYVFVRTCKIINPQNALSAETPSTCQPTPLRELLARNPGQTVPSPPLANEYDITLHWRWAHVHGKWCNTDIHPNNEKGLSRHYDDHVAETIFYERSGGPTSACQSSPNVGSSRTSTVLLTYAYAS